MCSTRTQVIRKRNYWTIRTKMCKKQISLYLMKEQLGTTESLIWLHLLHKTCELEFDRYRYTDTDSWWLLQTDTDSWKLLNTNSCRFLPIIYIYYLEPISPILLYYLFKILSWQIMHNKNKHQDERKFHKFGTSNFFWFIIPLLLVCPYGPIDQVLRLKFYVELCMGQTRNKSLVL